MKIELSYHFIRNIYLMKANMLFIFFQTKHQDVWRRNTLLLYIEAMFIVIYLTAFLPNKSMYWIHHLNKNHRKLNTVFGNQSLPSCRLSQPSWKLLSAFQMKHSFSKGWLPDSYLSWEAINLWINCIFCTNVSYWSHFDGSIHILLEL